MWLQAIVVSPTADMHRAELSGGDRQRGAPMLGAEPRARRHRAGAVEGLGRAWHRPGRGVPAAGAAPGTPEPEPEPEPRVDILARFGRARHRCDALHRHTAREVSVDAGAAEALYAARHRRPPAPQDGEAQYLDIRLCTPSAPSWQLNY